MSQLIIWLLFVAGVALIVAGLLLGAMVALSSQAAEFVSGLAALLGGLVTLPRWLREWRQQRRITKTQPSELARTLIPQLEGDYTPYVIEAAEQLGAARDLSAVPALMTALERCVEMQHPGWRDRAESLACVLGQIGDGSALPLLYRLENVRGIGFIPSIRTAIAAIEPHSSLLRAGSMTEEAPRSLLRAVQQRTSEDEKAVLLRAMDSEGY